MRITLISIISILLLCNISVSGQRNCDAFGNSALGANHIKSSLIFIDVGVVGMQQWLDPNIDSTITQQRFGLNLNVGKTAKRKFEWGLQFLYYRNPLSAVIGYNTNIAPFSTASHFEIGPWFWYSISKSDRLGLVASTGLNLVKIPDDPLATHISYLAIGSRFYPVFRRSFRLFLEPKFQFNPSYLIGSEVSLITYNYQFGLLFGARYIFR